MAEIPGRLLVHRVTVKPFEATTAYGPRYETARERRAMVDETRKLVRGSDGAEVVSEATVFLRRQYLVDFPPESLVTLPSGRTATVITAADRSDGGLGAWQHLEVTLT